MPPKGTLGKHKAWRSQAKLWLFFPIVNHVSLFPTRSIETVPANSTTFLMSSYKEADRSDVFRPLKQKPVRESPIYRLLGGSERAQHASLTPPKSCEPCCIREYTCFPLGAVAWSVKEGRWGHGRGPQCTPGPAAPQGGCFQIHPQQSTPVSLGLVSLTSRSSVAVNMPLGNTRPSCWQQPLPPPPPGS